nr:hypothetical protein [Devosia sp. A16]
MRIVRIDPVVDPSTAGGVVAHVDAQIGGVRLKRMILKRNMAGEYRIYPPKMRGLCVADIDKGLAAQITDAAVRALTGGRFAHGVDHD